MKFGTWDDNLAARTADIQQAARALEEVIREEMPDVVVTYDAGNGVLALGRGADKRTRQFVLQPHVSWVNLGLADGATLLNADRLIEGTGKRIRHVKVRTGDAARDPRLREIVRGQLKAKQP